MSELWRIKPDAAQFPEYYARYIDGIAVAILRPFSVVSSPT